MADFFDKMKQSVGKGVATASVKSKEMLDSNKVKNQIESLQKQKKESIEELGNIVYTMYLKDAIDEATIRQKSALITGIEEQIKEKEEELRRIHERADKALGKQTAAGYCPSCGAEIYENAKFCGKCGSKIETA